MPLFFRDILIPVDLSLNTEVAIKKALELSEAGTTIHLLHVMGHFVDNLVPLTGGVISNSAFSENAVIERKLSQWKLSIEESIDNVKVSITILPAGKVQKIIETRAKEIGADLIIVGKKSHHCWFPYLNTVFPNRMVKNTGIPVMTVKPGSIYNKIKTIVVPVYGASTCHKIDMILMICRKFNVRIHLVTFINDRENHPENQHSSIIQMYKQLKSFTHSHLEYVILHDQNKAKGILKYSEKVNADILLVYPGIETKIGWPNKYISDVLLPTSKVQILAVQPKFLLT